MTNSTWLLPQGVTELLPEDAMAQEMLRRASIDDLVARGFSLVSPPMMEFIDSLIQGAALDLDKQTFKFPDYDTHKTLGFRADITPQIAKIDAYRLSTDKPASTEPTQQQPINKLCYVGSVLRTQPSNLGGSRELLQIGCEIFGDDTVEADCQVVDAALGLFETANVNKPIVSIGHIGIYASIVQSLNLNDELAKRVFDAVLRKSTPDIASLNASSDIDLSVFEHLIAARGEQNVITEFEAILAQTSVAQSQRCIEAFLQIKALSDYVASQTTATLYIDLAELHGFRYHTGLTFQFFVEGEGRAIAKGGRYKGVPRASNSSGLRHATGFSSDLNVLSQLNG